MTLVQAIQVVEMDSLWVTVFGMTHPEGISTNASEQLSSQ